MTATASSRAVAIGSILVLLVALGCRVALALVNEYSPDFHIEVFEYLQEHGTYPAAEECWACFQPQLYYRVSMLWLDLLATLGVATEGARTVPMLQLCNALVGFGAVLIVAWWLQRLPWRPATRWFALALVACNPRWIFVNARLTNDTLVMFFAIAGAALLHSYFVRRRPALLWSAIGATLLANLTKGSALPTLGVLLVCLLLPSKNASTEDTPSENPAETGWPKLPIRALTAAATLLALYFFGNYATNLERHGSPFTLNRGKTAAELYPRNETFPVFYDHDAYFTEDYGARQPPWGPVAWESYLTFRPIDLAANPYNDIGPRVRSGEQRAPDHMRSIWTQLYAKLGSARFHPTPPEVAAVERLPFEVCRWIFILGLVPLTLLLIGCLSSTGAALRLVRTSKANLLFRCPDVVHGMTLALAAAFFVAYNISLSHLSASKPEYYVSGLCAVLFYFGTGREWLASRPRLSALRQAIDVALAALVLLCLADIVSVILQLGSGPA